MGAGLGRRGLRRARSTGRAAAPLVRSLGKLCLIASMWVCPSCFPINEMVNTQGCSISPSPPHLILIQEFQAYQSFPIKSSWLRISTKRLSASSYMTYVTSFITLVPTSPPISSEGRYQKKKTSCSVWIFLDQKVQSRKFDDQI